MINVLEYLDFAAQNFPQKIAYSDGVYGLTFAQVDRYSRSIGACLAQTGHYRIPIVILMGRSPDTAAAFWGTVRAGCAYVPVDPEMAMNRIKGIFSDLKPAAVIYDETTLPILESLNYTGNLYRYSDMITEPANDETLAAIRRNSIDSDLLYIVYTSGSTGQPKGVAACHRSVIDYIESLSEVLGFSHDTIFGNQTPLYVDASLKELYPTLKFGATTFLIPKNLFMRPLKLIEYLNVHKINTICWVASALIILSATGALENSLPQYLHTVAFGSERFPQAQLARWRKAVPQARYFNLYGLTECTGMSCWYEVTHDLAPGELMPIGKPFRNTRVMLLDGDNLVTDADHEGEICICGASLTLGYYNDAEKTNSVFVQNPLNKSYRELIYRTGDIGILNKQGDLIFRSRRDHQVKHMGHRIELGELENVAASMDEIRQAACVYDENKNKLALFFCGDASTAKVMNFLKERLPRFMCPNAVIPLETMPLTTNGKINRTMLLEIYKSR